MLLHDLFKRQNTVTNRRSVPVVPARSPFQLVLCLFLFSMLPGCYIDAPPSSPDVISERLSALLVDPDPDMRRTSAEALGKIGHRSATVGLLSALNDQDARVRAAAAFALGRLGGGDGVTSLVRHLADPAETVRTASALALGELERAAGREAQIVQALHHPDSSVRIAASRALLGLESISFSDDLVGALRDSNAMVRQGIVAALGETGDARVLPYFLALLRTDIAAGVRSEAAFRLGKVGDERVLADLEVVASTDSDQGVRGWARWATHQVMQSRGFDSGK